VSVSITSALTERKGAVGACVALVKQPSHDLWLPEFWDEGNYDHRHRQKSPFSPFVWAPENHGLGIDVGDEIAARGPAERPRLGIKLTESLKLVNNLNGGDWHSARGNLALRSQAWGGWKPSPDSRGARHNDDGEILWASPDWLTETLPILNKRLVYKVELRKYGSSRNYNPSRGVKLALVALRGDDGTLRVWQAKRASKVEL
jgi:hypothetical protein